MADATDWKGTKGFVYVATGDLFYREAEESAGYLRAANPGARVCLVTDRVRGEPFWDDVVVMEKPFFDFRDKMGVALCPYERFVFLDTDTYVAGDLGEMFTLLERFDVLGHQLFEGHDYVCPGVPDAFPEFNTGVFGVKRGPGTERMLARWREIFFEYRQTLKTGSAYDYVNASDQKGFRMALHESGVRHSVLGPEFNFIAQHIQFACAAVKILHGRPFAEMRRIERIVNAQLGVRAWVPILDLCVSTRSSLRGWSLLTWRAGLQALRQLGLVILPAAVRRKLRESASLRRIFLRNEEHGKKAVEHSRKWGR